MPDLDTPQSFAACDPKGMLAHIAGLPQQCAEAWNRIQRIKLPEEYHRARQVVVLGMGGSAIGADLLRGLLAEECPVPIIVHRDYGLPAFVDSHTLVIASSYSGNTEETLSGFDAAWARGAQLVAVTTGGELARRARQQGVPLYLFDYVAQPRAALGYSLLSLLGTLQHLGLVGDQSAAVTEAVEVMQQWQVELRESVPTSANAAKLLAQELAGRLPVVYGAEHLAEVARRWKGQFNENAKSWAVFDVVPELTHNTVAGYSCPSSLREITFVVVLSAASNHPRVRTRLDIICELLRQNGFAYRVVQARGQGKLAQVLSAVHLGDFVSYYLAMLYNVDPWEIANIDWVKERLSAM
jgi:glucose/mannose-6-phosphate isomerase